MVTYTNINEYINYLIENQSNVNIIDFVKKINKLPLYATKSHIGCSITTTF